MINDVTILLPELTREYGSDDITKLMRKIPGIYDKMSIEEVVEVLTAVDKANSDKLLRSMARQEIERSE
jgi:hypothetical protein